MPKISELATAVNLVGNETLPIVQNGITKKTTLAAIESANIPNSQLLQNYVVVKSVNELPAVDGSNNRNFDANTLYHFNVSLSDSATWVMGSNTRFLGVNGITETITYTGSGVFIKATDVRIALDDMVFVATNPAATLVEFNDSAGSYVCTSISTNYIGGAFAVKFNGCNIHRFDSCAFINQVTSSVSLNGVCKVPAYTFCQFAGNVPHIDTTGITANSVQIFRVDTCQWIPTGSSSIFLKIPSEAIYTSAGIGQVQNNIAQVTNLGAFLNGITSKSANKTQFYNNPSITDTQPEAVQYIATGDQASTTITVGAGGGQSGNPKVVAGTWTQETVSRFTTNAAGRITYTGAEPIECHLSAMFRVNPASGTNKEYRFSFRKNGTTVLLHSRMTVVCDTGSPGFVALIANASDVVTNDYFELVVENMLDSVAVTVQNATVIARYG